MIVMYAESLSPCETMEMTPKVATTTYEDRKVHVNSLFTSPYRTQEGYMILGQRMRNVHFHRYSTEYGTLLQTRQFVSDLVVDNKDPRGRYIHL